MLFKNSLLFHATNVLFFGAPRVFSLSTFQLDGLMLNMHENPQQTKKKLSLRAKGIDCSHIPICRTRKREVYIYIYLSNQGIISPVYICKKVCHFRWYRKPPKKIPGTGPLKNSVVYHRQTTSRKKQRIVFHSSKRRPSFLDLEVSNWPIPIPSMGLVLYVPTFSWFLW